MCLAIPMTIIKIDGDNALVERDGVQTEVKLTLVPGARINDKVLIHAGFAIEKLDEARAADIDEAWEELKKIGR